MLPPGVVSGFQDVHPKDPLALMEALLNGPVAVAIEADELTFQVKKYTRFECNFVSSSLVSSVFLELSQWGFNREVW